MLLVDKKSFGQNMKNNKYNRQKSIKRCNTMNVMWIIICSTVCSKYSMMYISNILLFSDIPYAAQDPNGL